MLCVCVTVCGHNNPNQRPVLTVKYGYIKKLLITLFILKRDDFIMCLLEAPCVYQSKVLIIDQWLVRAHAHPVQSHDEVKESNN